MKVARRRDASTVSPVSAIAGMKTMRKIAVFSHAPSAAWSKMFIPRKPVATIPTIPHADTTVSRWALSEARRVRSASRYSLMSRDSSRTSSYRSSLPSWFDQRL